MGVSNKNAQDNIQPKGNKKPLQVLHISKKDTQKIDNEQTNSQEEIKKENIAIKPQIIKDNLNITEHFFCVTAPVFALLNNLFDDKIGDLF